MVPAAGLEPARAKAPRILSPLCLPFHHAGEKENSTPYHSLKIITKYKNATNIMKYSHKILQIAK